MIFVASKKANIFFQDIKQIMGKSHFNILALNYGQKFLRKLNVYLTYLLKKYIKTIYLICMNYLMHDCLFIYFFSLFSLIFIVYIYLLIFFLNYNFSVRCRYSFLFVLFHVLFIYFLFIDKLSNISTYALGCG